MGPEGVHSFTCHLVVDTKAHLLWNFFLSLVNWRNVLTSSFGEDSSHCRVILLIFIQSKRVSRSLLNLNTGPLLGMSWVSGSGLIFSRLVFSKPVSIHLQFLSLRIEVVVRWWFSCFSSLHSIDKKTKILQSSIACNKHLHAIWSVCFHSASRFMGNQKMIW